MVLIQQVEPVPGGVIEVGSESTWQSTKTSEAGAGVD
jgi:hypothetical protein